MLGNLLKAVDTRVGRIVISAILGIGLASIFRKVCNSRDCLVFEAPPMKEVTENTYKYNGRCYRFKESPVACDAEKKIVEFA
jgi:hypothetical protein